MWRGKVVLVTGASCGIGAAFSRRIAQEGAHVVLTGRSTNTPSHTSLKGTLCQVRDDIRDIGGTASLYEMDVRNAEQINQVVDAVTTDTGRLDVLVNNASAIDVSKEPSVSRIDLMRSVNCRGTLLTTLACLSHLRETNGQILSLSPPIDNSQLFWLRMAPAYAMTKYGMTMSTLAFSDVVHANCIWPKRTIATAATKLLEQQTGTAYFSQGREPSYFADAMIKLLNQQVSGKTVLDEDLLPNLNNDAPLDMFVTSD